jgi:hypothetical protein
MNILRAKNEKHIDYTPHTPIMQEKLFIFNYFCLGAQFAEAVFGNFIQ